MKLLDKALSFVDAIECIHKEEHLLMRRPDWPHLLYMQAYESRDYGIIINMCLFDGDKLNSIERCKTTVSIEDALAFDWQLFDMSK